MPVMAEKRKNVAGRYNNQCMVSKPVNQIPAHINRPVSKKKAFIALSILSTQHPVKEI